MSGRVVGVTGANGFVGRRLCAMLEGRGDKVHRWDLPEVNMLDAGAVHGVVSGAKPSVVFHLAATGLAHQRAHDPSVIDENVRMSVNVLEACAEVGGDERMGVVMAGSMSEYGGVGTLSEEMRCDPTTAYGIAKLAVTNWARAYGAGAGLRVRVGRLFGVYGPGEQPHRLFPMLLKNLRAGTPVPLSDGLQRRDFIHVDDVCDGLVRLSEVAGDEALVVNLGTGAVPRVRDVARWMATALGADAGLLRFGARERSPGDADLIVADVTQLRQLTGWVPGQRLGAGMDVLGVFGGDGGEGTGTKGRRDEGTKARRH